MRDYYYLLHLDSLYKVIHTDYYTYIYIYIFIFIIEK